MPMNFDLQSLLCQGVLDAREQSAFLRGCSAVDQQHMAGAARAAQSAGALLGVFAK